MLLQKTHSDVIAVTIDSEKLFNKIFDENVVFVLRILLEQN